LETGQIPTLDVVFGFGPTLPFVLGAVLAWWFPQPWRLVTLQFTALWGTAILLFLSGVRRGLSFRTEGGPTWRQIATMLTLFSLGTCSLGAIWLNGLRSSLVLLLVGYSAIFVLDPIAAAVGEAPLYFRTLRRLQMPIIILALIASIAIALRA
jgi:Protein of unknown function (DUF3429)